MKNMIKARASGLGTGRCVYGVAAVGERGQIVIPKEARADLALQPGDKLIVLGAPGHRLILVKSDALKKFAEEILKKL